MNLNEFVEKIINANKRLIPLDSLQGKMKLNDYTKLLKELKSSKYCRPLSDDLKFNFVIVPSWSTKHKQYKLNGEVYSHIENLSIDSI